MTGSFGTEVSGKRNADSSTWWMWGEYLRQGIRREREEQEIKKRKKRKKKRKKKKELIIYINRERGRGEAAN